MHGDGKALLAWFRSRRRTLPWRGPFPRDPYTVLVSEVMLQQTQVDRVVPAYTRFMAAFPTVCDLAAADEDAVLSAFSGLGYYRRARLLHRAARAVVTAGAWPSDRATLRRLPGLGAYTSAAVAAFAFHGPHPPVDGNVARVASRLHSLALPLGGAALVRAAEAVALAVHADAPTPETWEALMELGATVCTPASPACSQCPLSRSCRAREEGLQETLPLPRPARRTEEQRWVALWVQRADGLVLLRRRSEAPLAGLWLPPLGELGPGEDAESRANEMLADEGLAAPLLLAPPVRHSITYRRIQVLPFVARPLLTSVREAHPDVAWHDWSAIRGGTSSLTAKLAAACGGERMLPFR